MIVGVTPHKKGRCRASGFVLVLLLFSVLIIFGLSLLLALSGARMSSEHRTRQIESAANTLQAARQALIGFAIGNFGGGSRPGQLPVPDILSNGHYDGQDDSWRCLDGSVPNGLAWLKDDEAKSAKLRCVGRLPWKLLGIDISGVSEQDAAGVVPWYAVSENLAAAGFCMSQLNPETAAKSTTIFSCPAATGPAWPWLKVCDSSGRLLSDRVAFVLIHPGAPISTFGRKQKRSAAPLSSIIDFLDAIPAPAGIESLPTSEKCSTFDNAALTGEFVQAPMGETFNDQLIYVTIDELMIQVEARVAYQVREALLKYRASYGALPWLTPLSPLPDGNAYTKAQPGNRAGFVPFYTLNGASDQRFLTEIAWSIGNVATDDTVSPANSSSPTFNCYGGTFQCRLRTSASAAIPRTITTAEFQSLKNYAITTASVACSYNGTNKLDCDPYTFSSTKLVSYNVERRLCCNSGGYTLVGTFAGTQTRSITISFGLVATSQAYQPADATHMPRRSLTTSSISTYDVLSVTDKWVPSIGTAQPFDTTAALITGTAKTDGNGVVSVSQIRLLPELPIWYFQEGWYAFVYALISLDSVPATGISAACTTRCLTAGSRTALDGIVISAGPPLTGQNRTGSPGAGDFLEAPNDTAMTTGQAAAINRGRNASYADSIATIPR